MQSQTSRLEAALIGAMRLGAILLAALAWMSLTAFDAGVRNLTNVPVY